MKTAIHVTDVRVYYGNLIALDQVNFEIPENTFVSIVGPNGAGKSTLLKCLLGLIFPDSGQIKLYGQSPRQIPPQLVGYVPQVKAMDRSFPAIASELVYSGLSRGWPWFKSEKMIKKVMQVMDETGVLHLAERPLLKLSAGELQRVCLARSLVREPKIILLDEPATGIDTVGEADMYQLLERYQKQSRATILMITHDWHAATHHSDLVLLLNQIQISFGEPNTALAEENVRRAFSHVGHTHSIKFL